MLVVTVAATVGYPLYHLLELVRECMSRGLIIRSLFLSLPYSAYSQYDGSYTVTNSVGGCSGKSFKVHSMTSSIDVDAANDATATLGVEPEMTVEAEEGASLPGGAPASGSTAGATVTVPRASQSETSAAADPMHSSMMDFLSKQTEALTKSWLQSTRLLSKTGSFVQLLR